METNLKYEKVWSFYGSIRSFSRVPGDAKPLENQVKCFCKFYCFSQTATFIPK